MKFVACNAELTTAPNNTIRCSDGWISVDQSELLTDTQAMIDALNNFASLLEALFGFDLYIFSAVLFAHIVFFIKGMGLGYLARMLART